MPAELDDIDFGADFETFAVGLTTVTVSQSDPDTGAATATATGVAAAKLNRSRSGDQLPSDTTRWTFRADQLGFAVTYRDQIVEADGTTWEVTTAEIVGLGALCSATATIMRG